MHRRLGGQPEHELHGLDELNLRILAELCKDGRIQYAELARRLRLSPNTVRDRVVAMQRRGIIRGFHALVDPSWYGKARTLVVLRHAPTYSQTPDAGANLDVEGPRNRGTPVVLKTWRGAGPYALILEMAGRSHEDILAYVKQVVYPFGFAQARLLPIGASLKPSRAPPAAQPQDLRVRTETAQYVPLRERLQEASA